VFTSLDDETAAQTLDEMPLKLRLRLAEELEPARLAAVIAQMETDEAAELTRNLSEGRRAELAPLLPGATAAAIEKVAAHSTRDAGSLMNTQFLAVPAGTAVDAVRALVAREDRDAEAVHCVYVVTAEGRLAGVLSLRDILVAAPGAGVDAVMDRKPVSVTVETRVRDVARLFLKYDRIVLPVLGLDGRLEGIVAMKDALEAAYPRLRRETDA
jgi:magnesium transporter